MITPRGMETTMKTWSMHTSFLINTSTIIQGELTHQRTELHFIRSSHKRTTIEKMLIKKSVICHECGNKGHIRTNCPNTKREK